MGGRSCKVVFEKHAVWVDGQQLEGSFFDLLNQATLQTSFLTHLSSQHVHIYLGPSLCYPKTRRFFRGVALTRYDCPDRVKDQLKKLFRDNGFSVDLVYVRRTLLDWVLLVKSRGFVVAVSVVWSVLIIAYLMLSVLIARGEVTLRDRKLTVQSQKRALHVKRQQQETRWFDDVQARFELVKRFSHLSIPFDRLHLERNEGVLEGGVSQLALVRTRHALTSFFEQLNWTMHFEVIQESEELMWRITFEIP